MKPYSKWIGKTPYERELINVLKLIIEYTEDAIHEIKTQS